LTRKNQSNTHFTEPLMVDASRLARSVRPDEAILAF